MITKLFSHSRLLTVISFITMAAAIAGVLWLLYDLQKERRTLSELQFAYESATQKSAHASSMRALLRNTEGDRVKLTNITLNNDPVDIIRALENAAAVARVPLTVSAVNPGSPYAEDPSLSSFLVAVVAEGTFQELNHFIALVETLPLPSSVEQVKFEKREKEWSAEMVVRIFFEENT